MTSWTRQRITIFLNTLSFIIIFQYLYNGTTTTSNLASIIAAQHDPQQLSHPPLQTQSSPQSSPQCTLQAIHGLSGNNADFMDEWEVNLKSVLMNAPLDCNMHLHIVADALAAADVHERIMKTPLLKSRWRNEITVTVHNIQERMEGWTKFLLELVDGNLEYKLTIGAYFRLFGIGIIKEYWEEKRANGTIVPMDMGIDWTLYMDPDVVILTNLNHLIETIDNIYKEREKQELGHPLYVWNGNSGFMTMNYATFDTIFWDFLKGMEILKTKGQKEKGDQSLLHDFGQKYPTMVGTIPDEWFTHMGHGFFAAPQELFDKQKRNAGFLHFTGKIPGTYFSSDLGLLRYCQKSKFCNHEDQVDVDKFQSTWGLADYYVRITWDWLIYQGGESRIRRGEEGHLFVYEERTLKETEQFRSP